MITIIKHILTAIFKDGIKKKELQFCSADECLRRMCFICETKMEQLSDGFRRYETKMKRGCRE